jgi:hypothetical protein
MEGDCGQERLANLSKDGQATESEDGHDPHDQDGQRFRGDELDHRLDGADPNAQVLNRPSIHPALDYPTAEDHALGISLGCRRMGFPEAERTARPLRRTSKSMVQRPESAS